MRAGPYRVDHDDAIEPLHVVEEVEPGGGAPPDRRPGRAVALQGVGDVQRHRVVAANRVAEAQDEDSTRSPARVTARVRPATRRRITSRTAPSSPRIVTTSGSSPGSACDAHALHGSYARNAISSWFSSAGSTFPLRMSPWAALRTEIRTGAALCCEATTRFAAVRSPPASAA